jgi:hypothetical protein
VRGPGPPGWGSLRCSSNKPDYAGNKSKSFNITRIYMFAILEKAKADTDNIRDLNMAVVRNMTAQVLN